MSAASSALVSFGFTALESEVYACLVRLGSATGYRIAQTIAKPAANTYKALESLQRKGAVVQDDIKKKSYAPIPPEVLIARLNKDFEKQKASALKAFKDANVPSTTGKLFPLTESDLAIQHASRLLAAAAETVVLIASKSVFEALAPMPTVENLFVMTNSKGHGDSRITEVPSEAFDFETLELVVDHKSAVMFTNDQGFIIENHPMAFTMHQAVVCQIGLYQVDRKLEEDASRKQMSRIIDSLP